MSSSSLPANIGGQALRVYNYLMPLPSLVPAADGGIAARAAAPATAR